MTGGCGQISEHCEKWHARSARSSAGYLGRAGGNSEFRIPNSEIVCVYLDYLQFLTGVWAGNPKFEFQNPKSAIREHESLCVSFRDRFPLLDP
jgi:hypothetical protein